MNISKSRLVKSIHTHKYMFEPKKLFFNVMLCMHILELKYRSKWFFFVRFQCYVKFSCWIFFILILLFFMYIEKLYHFIVWGYQFLKTVIFDFSGMILSISLFIGWKECGCVCIRPFTAAKDLLRLTLVDFEFSF